MTFAPCAASAQNRISPSFRIQSLELTAEQIIRDHTVLPFLMPFLDCDAIEKATYAMETHGHVEFFLGLAAMPSYPTHLRRCRKCSNFYRTKFGAVPWLRVHQLPGVAICPEHGVPLELSDVSARANIQIRKFVAADSPEIAFNRVCLPASTFSHLHYLSKSAQELLASNVPKPGPGRLASFYRDRLRTRGFIDKFGRVLIVQFTASFNNMLGDTLDGLQVERPEPCDRQNWLARLARPPRSAQSPVHHLLLLRFLHESVPIALHAALRMEPAKKLAKQSTVLSRRTARITQAVVDKRRQEWASLVGAEHRYGARNRHDAAYSWLWRNDREWLQRQFAWKNSQK